MTLVILKDTIFTPGFWIFFQDVLNNSKFNVFGLPIRFTADLNSAANNRWYYSRNHLPFHFTDYFTHHIIYNRISVVQESSLLIQNCDCVLACRAWTRVPNEWQWDKSTLGAMWSFIAPAQCCCTRGCLSCCSYKHAPIAVSVAPWQSLNWRWSMGILCLLSMWI